VVNRHPGTANWESATGNRKPATLFMSLNYLFYRIKPLIPRRIQIELRRILVRRKRVRYADVWPIDEQAAKPPEEWSGWPEGKQFALVLTHDVETAKGHRKCIQLSQLEENLGFRSSFNFVAEEYNISAELRAYLSRGGREIGVHGLYHNNDPFRAQKIFKKNVPKINKYLKAWGSTGFRSPCMYHNLDWICDLDIEYDASTFDTDPFEPQPDGMGTIFPFWVPGNSTQKGYVELPYTLPQDHTLFVLLGEKNINIWKDKLDWIAARGGMALVIVHPDYMNFSGNSQSREEYPAIYFTEFLEYIKTRYEGKYWHVLPKEMARFWVKSYVSKQG